MLKLQDKYIETIAPAMQKKFGYKNIMAVPKIEKVIANIGIGKILDNIDPSKREEMIKNISSDLGLVCGQKLILTRAKKAVAGFKIRRGSPVGLKVVLRKARMYEFLDRLINFALPRSRDFQGIRKKAIDEEGNLTIGIKEHIVFPEIQPEKTKVIFGLEVTIVTNTKKREEAVELYKLLGFPIKF